MALIHSPQIVTNGLVFYYDIQNTQKSWLGQPTTNLVGDGMSIYNNVSGDVSASLTTTGEYYKGATVYKLTLTPTTASGVSWLSNANNPGIGVVSGGGGGTANRYTGHSIFFKSTVPLASTPIYTHYSNIAGWQSSSNNYAMGDGWYKAHVIWYDTVTRSDGKYWAINPLSATLNVPIVIYWAGPFKEDRNNSTFVAQYTPSSRSNTQAVLDLTGQSTITAQSLTYNTDGTFSFNGSNYINSSLSNISNFTVEIAFKSDSVENYRNPIDCNWLRFNGSYSNIGPRLEQNSSGTLVWLIGDTSGNYDTRTVVTSGLNQAATHVATIVKDNLNYTSYYNGTQVQTGTAAYTWPGNFNDIQIGRGFSTSSERWFIGKIYYVRIYNRGLTASEVLQNFAAQRGLYGI
jgi:hypothetical protein